MTHAELDEIEKAAEKATKSPWIVDGRASTRIVDSHDTTIAFAGMASRVLGEAQDNAAYIALMSPDRAQRLVKRVRELEEALRGTLATMVVAATVFELPEARKEVHEAYESASAALAVSGEDVGK